MPLPDPGRLLTRTSRVRNAVLAACCAVLAACGNGKTRPDPGPAALAIPLTSRLGGVVVTVTLDGDRIAGVSTAATGAAPTSFLAPSIIDSHVHLAFWPVADQLADAGVAAAIDLGAPVETLAGSPPPITVLAAGPMLTQPGGYPLDAWGPDGFGVGCQDAPCVEATIDDLVKRGARVIKVAIAVDGLDPGLVAIAVASAHAHGLKVAAHALSDLEAAAAATAGCDLLAHTPLDPLRDATVAAWKGRAVISTLAAFGGDPDAIDNLRRLRRAGVTVLYGTDLGNQRDAGPSPDELRLLAAAGLDAPAILDAMTTTPARYWGLDRLGAIAPGQEASFLVLDADPRKDVTTILRPRAVWLRGKRR